MNEQKKESYEKHGNLEIHSYSLSQGLINFHVGAFGAYVFFFYETEILLNVILLALAMTIYIIWDAINDPLLGNITDRTYNFTKKWGRRFPWVCIGVFPWAVLYIFIFTTPNVEPATEGWVIFVYLIIILVAHDTFYTIWNVNSEALFPFKFPNLKERRKISGTKAFWGIIGLVLSIVVPPLFIEYGNIQSYINQAIALTIIAVIIGILMLPGHREDKSLIEQYLKTREENQKSIPFIKVFTDAIKKKNFMLVVGLHFAYSILTGLLIGSMNYLLKYNLREDPSAFILVMGAYLVVSLLTIPIWIKVAHRINDNKKMIVIGGLSMGLATLPLLLVNSLLFLIIMGALIGLTGGIYFVMQDAIFADALDETVVLDEERREGTYFGIKFFIGRFSGVFVFVSIALVHILTGFNPSISSQTPLALFGIRVHLALIPGIALIIGSLLFWKFYDITPKKSEEIQNRLNILKV
ncbi:MAG: MFS transporter [Candidatus Lokiarchaeota archaeon]|nr:MFS transporter [Candidatus Lokiarchaeota archaeon]